MRQRKCDGRNAAEIQGKMTGRMKAETNRKI